jgi:hypothetical protein
MRFFRMVARLVAMQTTIGRSPRRRNEKTPRCRVRLFLPVVGGVLRDAMR